jgi:hypothetical protein
VIVTLSFVGTFLLGSPVIPFEFSLLIVGSGVGAFGTVPVLAFVAVGGAYFLTVVFVHAFAQALGGTGDLQATVQAVGYAFAPTIAAFVPAALYGFQFLSVLVAITALPIALGMGALLYYGVDELHDLSRGRGVATVLGVAVLWALVAVAISSQMALAAG